MRVLLIEDDRRVAQALIATLARYDITTTWLPAGRNALAEVPNADFVLLDLTLPDTNGVALCQAIRLTSDVPIVILTGHAELETRVEALGRGADDYLVKPFNPAELVARIYAVTRRKPANAAPRQRINVADVEIDLACRRVTVAGDEVTVSRKEFQLLALLANEDGLVCPRERLIAQIWGRPWPGANETLNVHVANLRAKLGRPELVETIRGIGYRLSQPAAA